MNYIFLDVDGVLNNAYTRTLTHDGWCFVDDNLVQNLQKLVKETDSSLILSSTWRDGWLKDEADPDDISQNEPYFEDLVAKLKEFGMTLTDKTGEFRCRRGLEIHEYLDGHPEICHYVIIDDWYDMDDLSDHLVLTNPEFGFTEEDIEKAKEILKGE